MGGKGESRRGFVAGDLTCYVPRGVEQEADIDGRKRGFRVILPGRTRSLKHVVWKLVSDELRRGDLRRRPMVRRRTDWNLPTAN